MNFYFRFNLRPLFLFIFLFISTILFASNETNSIKINDSAASSNVLNVNFIFTNSPVLTKPAAELTYSAQIPVSLTIGEAYVAGSAKITFTNISGTYSNTLTIANNTLSQNFTVTSTNVLLSPNVTASTHSNLPDGTYNVTLSYRGNTALSDSSVTNANIVIQTITPTPLLTNPASGFVFNQNNAPVFSYTLPSAPYSGTAMLTLNPGYNYTLANSAGSKTYTITSNLPNDGTYTATVSYQDFLGNPAASSGAISVTFDRITLTPSILTPVTSSAVSGTATITYLAPETALSGSKKLIFSKNGTTVSTLNINDLNTGTLFLNFKNLTATSSQYALVGTNNIDDGTYSVTFSYQDINGNPASSSSIVLTIKERIKVNFVDAVNGNDTSGIGASILPYRTIRKAISVSSNGDSVILKKGVYKESIDFVGKSLLIGSQYDSVSNDTSFISQTILDGDTIGSNSLIRNTGISTGSYKIFGLTITNVPQRVISMIPNAKVQKCTIKNSGNPGSEMILMTSNQYLIDCDIYSNKAGTIIFTDRNTSNSAYILNTKIHHNNLSLSGAPKCVQFEGPLTMINCQVYKNYYQSAIEMGDNAQGVTFKLYFSTITENYGAGLNFAPWSGGYTAYVANNIIANNAQDLNFEDRITGPTIKMYNNLIPKGLEGLNINPFYNLTYSGNYNLLPIFNDTTNFDFTLKANSPGIGYGQFDATKNIDTISNDYQYNSRPLPLGSRPDIGAFESSFKLPAPTLNLVEPNDKKAKLVFSIDSISKSLDTILGYKIYRSLSGISDNSNITAIGTINSANLFSFIDSVGLTNNSKYYYRIKIVYKDNTLSGFSNQVSAIPNNVNIPSNIKFVNNPSSVILSWDTLLIPKTKYQIFRGVDSNTKVLLADTITGNKFTDNNITRNTKYFYWLRSIDSNSAVSNYSSTLSINPTNIWYVDSASGNNSTGIGTQLAPFKTIQNAIDLTLSGDTILVKTGTYIENLLINKKITIISLEGALKTAIKPLLPNSQIVNFTGGALDSKIKGFKLFNGGSVRGSAIDCNFSNPIIENCIITNSAGEAPIRFYYSAARITNCLIYKNTANNVFFYDPNDYVPTITHSTIAYNVGIGTGASNSINIPIFTNSIIYGNTGGSYSGNINILNSIVQGGYPGNNTNVDANPRFLDSLNNDFHLSSYSPAIGIGKLSVIETKDFELNNRIIPIGSYPDAGAFENINDHPAPYLTDSTNSSQIKISNYQYPTNGLNKIYIYKGLSSNPILKTDSIGLVNSYIDTANKIFNKYIYYRFTSKGGAYNESGFSNEIKTILFTSPVLITPQNKSVNVDTSISLKWSKVENALKYNLNYSTDSTFNSSVIQKLVSDTFAVIGSLKNNTTYFWKIQATDSVYTSPWSSISKFQTFIAKPSIDSVKSNLKSLNLYWTNKDSIGIKYIKIYRDTNANASILLDSVSGASTTYKDVKSLILNQKYYYKIKLGNKDNIESDFSNIVNATPLNTNPKAVKLLNKSISNAGEYNYIKLSFTAVGSTDADGKIAGFNWYVNDSLVNKVDSVINYYFKLGTNTIKLVVVDNDGGKDSSSATVSLVSLNKQFRGGILGGISALNPNIIYTADSTYDAILGSSISILDRSGNSSQQIVVQNKIFTTPSVASDTSVFITSGSNLNGFNKSGVALWPTVPLGGISYVTPTIDSLLGRIYVGVSNKNFFAYDYKKGTNIWSVTCDAPINTSAVISADRKLIFTSQVGTLYGFDISKSDVQTTPKWKISFGDIVLKSPAVDANGFVYIGTDAGRFIKFKLNADGSTTLKWNVTLSGSIQCSPVIDADGYIYVGNEKGDFYKIDPSNGQTIWVLNVGSAIRSTPYISEYGSIYVATMKGLIYSLSANKQIKWKYQDSAPISANILFINNMLYVGNESGLYYGIYDNPNSVNVNVSFATNENSIFNNPTKSLASSSNKFLNLNNAANMYYLNAFKTNNFNVFYDTIGVIPQRKPMWGTFQGDFRRSGNSTVDCPSSITIKKDTTGALVSTLTNYTQWYKDGAIISGFDSIAYKPTTAGSYSVKSILVGCQSVSSNSYYYVITDIANLQNGEYIKLAPNPFNNQVNFDFLLRGYLKLNLEVFDIATGTNVAFKQNLVSGESIYLGHLSAGTYLFKASSNDIKFSYQIKMIKL